MASQLPVMLTFQSKKYLFSQHQSLIAQFHQTYRCQKLIDYVEHKKKRKVLEIDLISSNKSNKTSSTLSD